MTAFASVHSHPLGCIIPLHFCELLSQPKRLGIPLPLGCISLSSAGSLAFGRSYPVAGGRLFPCRQYVKDRAGAVFPRRGYSLRWEQTAYHAMRVACSTLRRGKDYAPA
nr:MAG TPA: hypothetical protein [Caudoviricetes sp.]